MLDILFTVLFLWLLVKAIGFAFKLTWGITKIIACVLMVLALPSLILCLLFASGIALLAPIAMMAIAAGILKACL
jgi:hypothetical protein